MKPLYWLLAFIPIALGLSWTKQGPIAVFAASALAIVPLAALMGDATEALAEFLGPTWGGLLNATLGNAPEIIISVFALREGLVEIVKSSLTGSIVGNLLFGMGLSMFAAGVKNPRHEQTFDPKVARVNAALLMLATFGLVIPAIFVASSSNTVKETLSLEIAGALFLLYLASLVFTLLRNRAAVGVLAAEAELEETQAGKGELGHGPGWGRNKAIVILAGVAVALAFMSELLTGAIEPASERLGMTPLFSGVFLLALVGNAAELFNAVRFACKDQMDLSLGITMGASTRSCAPGGAPAGILRIFHGPGDEPGLRPFRDRGNRPGGYRHPGVDLRRRLELAGGPDADRALHHARIRVLSSASAALTDDH